MYSVIWVTLHVYVDSQYNEILLNLNKHICADISLDQCSETNYTLYHPDNAELQTLDYADIVCMRCSQYYLIIFIVV